MSWDIESNDAPLAGCLLYMAGIFNRCHGTHFCYSLEEASDVFFFFFFHSFHSSLVLLVSWVV